uniref:RNA polymerase II-associated protein 3 n=1 Tax=Clastoptera arizonana TaxID=38151 RepID=A0A1B6CMH6_9HEMI
MLNVECNKLQMDASILIQKQIRDNSDDLHSYIRDLTAWETEMKRKDKQLSNITSEKNVLPPIRRKKKEPETVKEKKTTKRIPGHDYASWEKFDVEKVCEELDNQNSEESTEETNFKDEKNLKKEEAQYEKLLGNRYVQDGKWDEAIAAYSRAIAADPNDAIFYANRALCYLKKNMWKDAESDCTRSIYIDKTYVKSYHRRAEARKQLEKFEEAKQDLLIINQLEPKNVLAQNELKKLETKLHLVTAVNNSISENIAKSKEEEVEHPLLRNVEPTWSLEGSVVEPIKKPPHLKSKKPLKRIVIDELSSETDSYNTLSYQIQSPDKSNLKSKNKINPSDLTKCDEEVQVPPPPKTSVQFETSWKRIQNNRAQCFTFLKQIQGKYFPIIFKDSLESTTLSNILSVLTTECIPSKHCVYEYLEGLSQVPRFKALTMFLTLTDKSNLNKLFEHCQNSENLIVGDIQKLKKMYEL